MLDPMFDRECMCGARTRAAASIVAILSRPQRHLSDALAIALAPHRRRVDEAHLALRRDLNNLNYKYLESFIKVTPALMSGVAIAAQRDRRWTASCVAAAADGVASASASARQENSASP